ncbi:MAG TPA: branched-chain amino acid ABC transporter permease [Burkholderiaceae bacterium]
MAANRTATEVAALPPAAAPSPLRFVAVAAVIAAACVLPFVLPGYRVFQATLVIVNAIALLGLNLLTGYSGQISLGHGAFYAIGAYAAAILSTHAGVPYWLAIPLAGMACFCAGFLFGLPALRLEPLYLAVATFSLGVALPQILKCKALTPWTGGVQGLVIDKPSPPQGVPLSADQWLYFVALAFAVPLFVAAANVVGGRIGRALIAIRDHPVAARAMGVDSAWYKTATFGVSALYTGVAGALSAIAVQFVAPDAFNFFFSLTLLVGIVIGGLASISGAIWGAVVIQFLPDVADQISKSAPWAVYGALLIGVVYAMPLGIAGALRAPYFERIRRARARRD